MAQGTTVGYKRILKFDETVADSLRMIVNNSRRTPNLKPIEAYHIVLPTDVAAQETEFNVVNAANTTDGATLTAIMAKPATTAGFIYTPAQGAAPIFKYQAQITTDGKSWSDVATTGEFSNIFNNPMPQRVAFAAPLDAMGVRLVNADGEATGKIQILTVK